VIVHELEAAKRLIFLCRNKGEIVLRFTTSGYDFTASLRHFVS